MKKLICSAFVVIMMSLALTESSKAVNDQLVMPRLVAPVAVVGANGELIAAKDGHLRDGALRLEYGADALGVSPGVALAWMATEPNDGTGSTRADREAVLKSLTNAENPRATANLYFRELRQLLVGTGRMQ
ncbi:hypothetical protein FACS189472_09150 [Alphaproteobacteria bacterium]|nr:hypothetical protein FACS189472_09150 [Alphaproteobacteria bacterium]